MNYIKIRLTIIVAIIYFSHSATGQLITASDIIKWENPTGYERIYYGDNPLQFGDLRIPESGTDFPVAILIHGGCYLSEYSLGHLGLMAKEITEMGIATWSIEYRKIGDEGGGWPGTFQDISDGTNFIAELVDTYKLDLNNVIIVGHSSGGHAALWLGGYTKPMMDAPARKIELKGILALAAVTDLSRRHASGDCDDVVEKLMGGSPMEVPERYNLTSPMEMEMSQIDVPQILIVGTEDREARIDENERYYKRWSGNEENIQLILAEGSGHFELIFPESKSWNIVRTAVLSLLKDY